ncbi:MAG: DUF2330 domain-containing protein [Candidatus Paceibacterota bacterium]|jgi:hypothetical protein
MKKTLSCLLVLAGSLALCSQVLADGGMIPIDPNVIIRESEQNAIVGWDGKNEVLILSTDVSSNKASTEVMRIFALPAKPESVEEGTMNSFIELQRIMNQKIAENQDNLSMMAPTAVGMSKGPAAELVFADVIGAHDIKVIKVNNANEFLRLDYLRTFGIDARRIPLSLKTALDNYMLRGINYFSFDQITVGPDSQTVKPLIFKFKSSYFFYPIKITAYANQAASSDGDNIHVFAVTAQKVTDQGGIFNYRYPNWHRNQSLWLMTGELYQVSDDIGNLFAGGAYVTELGYNGSLANTKDDIIFYQPSIWQNNFKIGSRGEDVVALQKILINEELWNEDVSPTGYFGPTTKQAVIRFQEKYRPFILDPLQLSSGTGFVGPFTRQFLKKFQMQEDLALTPNV